MLATCQIAVSRTSQSKHRLRIGMSLRTAPTAQHQHTRSSIKQPIFRSETVRNHLPSAVALLLLATTTHAQDIRLPQGVSTLLPDAVREQLISKFAPLFKTPTGRYSHQSESITQNGSMTRECVATRGGFTLCNDYYAGNGGIVRTVRLMAGPLLVAEESHGESGFLSRITLEELSTPSGRSDGVLPNFLYFTYKHRKKDRSEEKISEFSEKCYARDYVIIEINGEQEIGPRHFQCFTSQRGAGEIDNSSIFLPSIGAFVTPELTDLRREKNWRVHNLLSSTQ